MTSSRIMRVGTVVLLWLAAAAGATAVGMAAVGMIGSDIFGSSQEPLTQAEVEQRLASPAPTPDPTGSPTTAATGSPSASPSPAASPSPSPSPSPGSPGSTAPPAAAERTINANGAGTVTARCGSDGVTVEVLYAAPAQGFEVDADDDEDDDHPQVKFENDAVEVEVRLRCVDGVVTDEIQQKTED